MVFNDLRPRQRINLEKIVPLPIVDRTMLILDIFAQHARSREGQLQVELAQLRYRQSNLIGSGVALSRLGGGVGTRGPGETKLEVDRRKIAARVTLLGRQLEEVRKQRATRRSGGGRDPFVALVGYTNVGKSSLLNRLAGTGGNALRRRSAVRHARSDAAARLHRRGPQHSSRRHRRLHHRAAERTDQRVPRDARRTRRRRRAAARRRCVEPRLAAPARERRGDPRRTALGREADAAGVQQDRPARRGRARRACRPTRSSVSATANDGIDRLRAAIVARLDVVRSA